MKLSNNERKFLEAMRDNEFHTIAQITLHCGFNRAMGYHYYRSLSLGGLVDGFDVTYAGYKMLQGEDLIDSDNAMHVDLRIANIDKGREY